LQIDDILFAPGLGAFFYDDQAAIRAGAANDGFVYLGEPHTPGFTRVREPAQSLGIGLTLSDGETVWGDMMSVQYSGAGGRDPLFTSAAAETVSRQVVVPRLQGLSLNSFRDASATALAYRPDGTRLPLAVEYGVSQAILRAVARAKGLTMAEVVCAEYGLPVIAKPVPLYAQSGDAREINVDKMILKHVAILPHGLINNRAKFGPGGQTFREFIRWTVARVQKLGREGYAPTLHFDLYGWVGLELGLDIEAIADFICRAAEDAAPLNLNVESPADFGDRETHIAGFVALTEALKRKGCATKIVVDERCNTLDDIKAFAQAGAGHIIQIKTPDVGAVGDTVEAVLACKQHGVDAYVGGSCVETDLSAQVTTHIAVATQAEMMLAKPGMGVDEGLTIVGNEQSRLLALLNRKASRRG
jgi:methylaspartate ammonia-lyase